MATSPTRLSALELKDNGIVDPLITIPQMTSAPSTTTSKLYNLNGVLYFEGTSLEGGGSGTPGSLEDAYSLGRAVTVDEGAVSWTDATTGSANTMEFVKSGAGSGNVLDFAINAALTGNVIDIDLNTGLGAKALYIDAGNGTRTADIIDIKHDGDGNIDVFTVTATNTGTGAIFNIDMNGNGSTDGVFNVDMNEAVGAEFLYLDAGAGTRTADLISIKNDGDGNVDCLYIADTNSGSGHVVSVTVGGLRTGNVIDVDMNVGVGSKAIYLDGGNAIRTADLIDIKHDGSGNADVMNITATNTGTGAIFDINMDGDGSDAGVFNVDMNEAVGAEFVYLDAGGGTRTANLFEIVNDGDGNVDLFSITDTNIGSGSLFDISMDGIGTGSVMDVDMNAAVGEYLFNIDAGGGTRTVALEKVKFDGDGNVGVLDIDCTNTGTGSLINIDITGIHAGKAISVTYGTAASTGDAVELAMGTAVAASALVVTAAGNRTDDLFKIDDSSASNAPMFDINFTGAHTGGCFDVHFDNASQTGAVMNVDMDGAVGAQTFTLDAGGGTRTVDMMEVTFDGDGDVGFMDITVTNTGSGNILEIDVDSVHTGSLLAMSYGTGAATGDAISLAMGTNVAGRGVAITSAATGVSGEGAAIDITHTGNLVAGADVLNITSSGDLSSTSNLLALEQATGACTAGANALYINATGANCEAIKVDAGDVTFDEDLTVGGTMSVTGAVTLTAGVQSAAVGRTVTAAPGGTTGVIADGTSVVEVTSDDANKVLTLPTPTPGNIVWVLPNATGYELRTSDPATVAINGGTGANAESAVSASVLVRAFCSSATTWVCSTFAADGTEAKLEAAA